MNSWIQYNKPSVVAGSIGLVLFLGIAGLGVHYWMGESDLYKKIERAQSDIKSMAARKMPPTPEVRENVAALTVQYEKDMETISKSFESFRENSALPHIDPQSFQNALKAESTAWQNRCKEKNITVATDARWMGFGNYQSSAPPATASTLLSYQKGGIEHFLDILTDNGVTKFTSVFRPLLPVEQIRGADEQRDMRDSDRGMWEYMPFEVTFEGNRQSVASILNAINKSEKYLYVMSAMRVKNEKPVAPVFKVAAPPAPKPAATQVGISLAGTGTSSTPAQAPPAEEAAPAVEEILRPVLGDEKVQVHLAVNLVHFAQPQNQQVESDDADEDQEEE